MLWNLRFDAFTFARALVNELENEDIYRRTCDGAVGRVIGHTFRNLVLWRAAMWSCYRCLRNDL